MALLLLVASSVGFLAFTSAVPAPCAVEVNVATGTYTVSIGGEPWLASAPTRFHSDGRWYSSADKTLVLTGHQSGVSGSDGIGQYTATTLSWKGGDTRYQTVFRQYASACVFEQVYPDGASNMSLGNTSTNVGVISSAFPSFDVAAGEARRSRNAPRLGYFNWQGEGVPGNPQPSAGLWPPAADPANATGSECRGVNQPAPCALSGVLAIFEEGLGHTAVLSPANNFIVAAHQYELIAPVSGGGRLALSYGLQSRLTEIPAGFGLMTILQAAAAGPNAAMQEWGGALLRRSGKPKGAWRTDRSLNTLGYTTDNGAYYYYNTINSTCYHTARGCIGYEETVYAIKAHADELRVPFRWILYDSWFYAKANDDPAHPYSAMNGVTNWTEAAPEIFPSGLAEVYARTGWNVVGHNRAWAASNVYDVKNGGKYEMITGSDDNGHTWSLPKDEAFWDMLFEHDQRWGLWNYQQDWMYTQQGMLQMMESPLLARTWTLQMDAALMRRGMHYGFGGVSMGDWLQGTEMLSATNGRISQDYHSGLPAGMNNWQIGLPSIFAWALDLIPAKDGWWSTAEQPGHPYPEGANRTEPYSALHAAVATLSHGPVTPADGIGYFNRSLIMRSCMEDGTLLQPDAPVLGLDTQLRRQAFGSGGPDGQAWSTYTTLSGATYHQLLVAQLRSPYTATEWPPAAGGGHGYVLISNAAGILPVTATVLGPKGIELAANDRADFELLHASPVLSNGWALVGETAKWVPVSANRVASVALAGSAVEVELIGTAGEEIALSFTHSADVAAGRAAPREAEELPIHTVSCIFPQSGRLSIAMPAKSCTPV